MNSQTKSSFAAIPVELNNYYPFGLPEAGRSWSYEGGITNDIKSKYNDYTYGFNGMQRDNAKGLGSGYTTLFREYDPEIARWRSLDPKLKDFPSESPFSAMGNNPIMNTDVLGDKVKVDEQKVYQNQESGESLELFLTSKAGKQFWMDHAEKGQSFTTRFVKDSKGKPITLMANKNGTMHDKCMDVLFSTEDSQESCGATTQTSYSNEDNESEKKDNGFNISRTLFTVKLNISTSRNWVLTPKGENHSPTKERTKIDYTDNWSHEALLEVWRAEDCILKNINADSYYQDGGYHKNWWESPYSDNIYNILKYTQKYLWNGHVFIDDKYIKYLMVYSGCGWANDKVLNMYKTRKK